MGELDPAHAGRLASLEDTNVGDGEANAFAGSGRQQYVVVHAAKLNPDDAVVRRQFHRDLAGLLDVGEIRQFVTPHVARLGGEQNLQPVPGGFLFGQRQDRGDALAFLKGKQIDHGLAAALDARLGQPPYLHAIDHADRGKEQQRRMRIGDEDMRDEIFLARGHAGAAFAAPSLDAVFGQSRALDIAGVRHRDGDVLTLDQVFVFDLHFGVDDLGPARRRELRAHRSKPVFHDREHARPRAQISR